MRAISKCFNSFLYNVKMNIFFKANKIRQINLKERYRQDKTKQQSLAPMENKVVCFLSKNFRALTRI